MGQLLSNLCWFHQVEPTLHLLVASLVELVVVLVVVAVQWVLPLVVVAVVGLEVQVVAKNQQYQLLPGPSVHNPKWPLKFQKDNYTNNYPVMVLGALSI